MAMGYRLTGLLAVVAREGFLLAILGFLPAWLAGEGLYVLVRTGTKLPVYMDAQRLIVVFAMILLMCLGSAAMAMRKLADADPAEIF